MNWIVRYCQRKESNTIETINADDFPFFLAYFSLCFFFLMTDICPDIIPDVLSRETLIRFNDQQSEKFDALRRCCLKAKIA